MTEQQWTNGYNERADVTGAAKTRRPSERDIRAIIGTREVDD